MTWPWDAIIPDVARILVLEKAIKAAQEAIWDDVCENYKGHLCNPCHTYQILEEALNAGK